MAQGQQARDVVGSSGGESPEEHDPLDAEIEAYDRIKAHLEATEKGKWAVVADQKLWRTFDTFHEAASAAEENFGDRTFMIRRVGSKPAPTPSSVLFGNLP